MEMRSPDWSPSWRRIVTAGAVLMLPLAAAAAAADAPAVDAAPPPYPFAMCSNGNMLSNPEYPVKMLDAGARMCRVDVTFNTVRPQPGDDPDTWNWNTMEKIRGLRKQHPDLQFLVLLGYGPAWAEDPKFKPEKPYTGPPPYNCPQAGVNVMPPEDPKNLYGHYVYETVRRYKDVTKHWESWNEPDLPGAHYFKGNGKDFFAYQKACYLAAKKADPECNVVFAGLCYATFEGYLYVHKLKPPTPYPPKTCFFEEYLREGVQDPDAKRNNYYFDIMNQHSYSRASDLYDYAAVDAKLMQDYLGEVKPIWVTEMGMTDNGPNAFGGTPADYAEYQLQAFAWGKLAGVERFFHFQLDNSNQHGLYKGMLGEPKPALTTYRDVLVKEFAQAKFVKQLHGSTGVDFLAGNSPFDPKWKAGYNAFEFRSHDGRRRLLIAFADTADAVAVKLPATQAKATLITSDNQRREIAAKDGSYEIALTGAVNFGGWPVFKDNKDAVAMGQPEFLVGGATVVIVEE